MEIKNKQIITLAYYNVGQAIESVSIKKTEVSSLCVPAKARSSSQKIKGNRKEIRFLVVTMYFSTVSLLTVHS